MDISDKVALRKQIARYKRLLPSSGTSLRRILIEAISDATKKVAFFDPRGLPVLGKFRLIVEKDLKEERRRLENDPTPSENDLKRLALKESFYEYYMDLNYDYETPVVDYYGAMNLRRDDQDVDMSDFDFAPNKNEIYQRWMDKLSRYIREERLSDAEFDEAAERGTPQGGAFEKQLDRYRQDIMKQMWQSYE